MNKGFCKNDSRSGSVSWGVSVFDSVDQTKKRFHETKPLIRTFP